MEQLDIFLRQFTLKTYQKGQVILCEGDEPQSAYVIKKGVIKTYNLTSDGQEKPISFDIEHEVFPVGWVFSRLNRAQYYYEAFTDCEIYLVPREEYVSFVRNNNDIMYWALDALVLRQLNYQMRINALEQSKAADKVLHTLHFLCIRFGRDVSENVVKIQLPLTHQDLANFMGLTRETTGIELKKLEKAGIISYRRQNYIIKTDRLNDLLDLEYDYARILES